MPNYADETKKYQESRVRSVMIFQPDASLRAIQDALENSKEAPMKLELHYLAKIRDKILKERRVRNNNLNLGARLSAIQDEHKAVKIRLWKEATDPHNKDIVRVMALEKLLKTELDLLNAEMDAGFYERKLGTVEVDHSHTLTLDKEMLAPIILALQNYGLADRKIVENENATDPTKTALPDGSGKVN
jgi:hypothetical protein